MAGPRRRAREVALQILIQSDVSPEIEGAAAVRLYFDHLADIAPMDDADSEQEAAGRPPAVDRALVDELVLGVASHRDELDAVVQDLSRNWRLERMALVERNIIRLALYEMKYAPSIPTNVALNEAVELAKRFGTSEGAAFVNGLLDRAATELHLRR
jgi:transcription antitermination protein NusB